MNDTLIKMPNEQNISFKNTLDNLLSTRKELSKTNYILEQKYEENAILRNQIKKLEINNETLIKKNKELEKEIFLSKEEKNDIEQKLKKENEFLNEQTKNLRLEYEQRFTDLKKELEKSYKNMKKDEFDSKIKNSNSLFDMEKNTLKEKNKELEKQNINLEQNIKNIKKELDELTKENNDLKIENISLNENKKLFNTMRIDIKADKEKDKEKQKNILMINELKIELNMARKEISRLNNLLNGYKTQNNQLTIKFEQIKKEKDNEIENLRFSENLHKKQIFDISTNLRQKEKQIIEVQSELDVVINTKNNLEKNFQIEKRKYENESIEIQKELNILKEYFKKDNNDKKKENKEKAITSGDYFQNDTIDMYEEMQQLRKYIDKRNSECDEILEEYNKLKNENNVLKNKLNDMKLEYEKNIGLDNKYGIEGRKLYDKIEKLKKEKMIILNKKNFYKQQCILCNEIIDLIKEKLTKQQYKEIENDKIFRKLQNEKLKNKAENDDNYNNYNNIKNNEDDISEHISYSESIPK